MSETVLPDQIASHCLSVLEAGDYEEHADTLRIMDLSFEFDRVLTGPYGHQLVLLVDQPELAVDALKRRLSSLALALSRTGSRRPVTLLLIAPRLDSQDVNELRQLARLVAVDRVTRTSASLDHILREFRPLATADASAPRVNAIDELHSELGVKANRPHIQKLIKAASKGPEAVELAFQMLLDEAIADPTSLEI